MSSITPFSIDIDENQLADLKLRLAMTRLPDRETPQDWSQGIPLAFMQSVKTYWEQEYQWSERQALLNQWPGFKTNLDGINVHFLHIRSKHDDAKPLLMTHGWPGSIVEFQKIIPLLTHPELAGGQASEAFHVICPSIPGPAIPSARSGSPG